MTTIQDRYNQIKSSVYSNTEGQLEVEKDPFARAFAKALADMGFDLENLSIDSVAQSFSRSVTDEAFLKAIAFDKTRNQIRQEEATVSNGEIIVISDTSLDIPSGTQFITSDGEIYDNQITRTTNTQTFLITSVSRVSNEAICVLEDHNLPTNFDLTIAGINEADFNGVQTIEVVDKDTFKYPSTGPDIAATGTITGSYFGSRLDLQSENASSAVNKTFTESIEISDAIDLTGSFITFNGIIGGTDKESFDDFKARVEEFLGSPQNKGNLLQHRSWVKQNTEANYVYFYQDEDDINILLYGIVSKLGDDFNFTSFTNDELTAIKNQFIADNQLLLGVNGLNLTFANPSFVNIDINVIDLSPNTIEMQDAVRLVIKEYLAKLPIKFFLTPTLVELSNSEIESIVKLTRDSNGTVPSFTSAIATGGGGLDAGSKKTILGTITYG